MFGLLICLLQFRNSSWDCLLLDIGDLVEPIAAEVRGMENNWTSALNPLMGTLKPQSNRPLYSNTVIGTLAVDGWYSEEEPGRAVAGDVNFMKYFKNFTIFSGFTLTRLTFFYTSNITFYSFMHTAAP